MDVMNEETMKARAQTDGPSVNKEVERVVEGVIRDAQALRVDVSQGPLGETRIDCGVRAIGGLEAGRRMGEICLGGLGRVTLETTDPSSAWPFNVTVHTNQPVLACLGSQYAGWSLSVEDKGKKYHVLGSGPARALGSPEKLFDELGYRDKADRACSGARSRPRSSGRPGRACRQGLQGLDRRRSPSSTRRHRASPARCRSPRAASRSRCTRRMSSISRSHDIVDGMATAPLPPPAPGFVAAMGRTNDAIIYGGRVQLFVSGSAKAAKHARRPAAEPQVEGLWQAVRRHLRRGEGRLLRHRPHAVQPGQGDRHGARIGRELRGRPYRHGDPVPLLLLLTAMAAEIVLFCERKKWHGRSISRALRARGIRPLTVSLAACGFSTETRTGLAIPGLGDHLPKGALVLFVPGGSFEQVTTYLGVLHALRELGVTVWNDARAIERCVDKSTTTFFLQKRRHSDALDLDRRQSRRSLRRRRDQARARPQARAEAAVRRARRRPAADRDARRPRAAGRGERRLLSAGVHSSGRRHAYRDWRIFVSAGRVVAAMIRHGSSWITNIKQGARAESAIPSKELADLALRAVACVGADYAGVDIIQDRTRRASRARGEQHAGLARVTAGHAHAHRRFHRRALPRRLPRSDGRRACRAAKRAREGAPHSDAGCPSLS